VARNDRHGECSIFIYFYNIYQPPGGVRSPCSAQQAACKTLARFGGVTLELCCKPALAASRPSLLNPPQDRTYSMVRRCVINHKRWPANNASARRRRAASCELQTSPTARRPRGITPAATTGSSARPRRPVGGKHPRGVWRVPIHSFRKRMLGGRHELRTLE